MTGWVALLPGGVALAIAAVASLLAARGTARDRHGRQEPESAAVTARIARRATVWRSAGLLIGVVAALALAGGPPDWLGLGVALAAPTFAMCLLAGVLVGELAATVPAGPTRHAALEVRTIGGYLPRVMTWWVAGLTGGLVVFLVLTGVAGQDDDQGRIGRGLSVVCGPDQVERTSPWPGVYYGVPIMAAGLAGLGGGGGAGGAAPRRRRPLTDPAGRAADDRIRRTSARAVVAACGVLVAAPLAGSALLAGTALFRFSCASTQLQLAGWGSRALALFALVSTCVFVVHLLAPGRRTAA